MTTYKFDSLSVLLSAEIAMKARKKELSKQWNDLSNDEQESGLYDKVIIEMETLDSDILKLEEEIEEREIDMKAAEQIMDMHDRYNDLQWQRRGF